MLSLKQAVPDQPGTIMVLESTANGVGNWFHEQWFAAKAGETDFIAMFFPWWRHFEYAFPDTTLQIAELVEDEREIMRRFPEIGLPQLAWRRWAIRNLCDNDISKFNQEYPNDDHEAFLSTGRNVFPIDALEKCYEPKKGSVGFLTPIRDPLQPQGTFHKDGSGNLTIYKHPAPGQKYVVAGDPTRTTWGDPACIQVLNRYSLEQVAVWHGHCTPVPFADRLAELGHYYNTATVNCEVEGGGLSSINILTSKMFYPDVWRWRVADKMPGHLTNSYGWSMNWQRKHMAISFIIDRLAQGMLRIHDEVTIDQMAGYVVRGEGELGPATTRGCDDAVMSLAIAVATICLDLESSRDPATDLLQSYRLELEGNVFSPPAPQESNTNDIHGVPFWEEIDAGV
jgi:hypothetical protein